MLDSGRFKEYKPRPNQLPADEKPPYAVVQMDFEDFFDLMRLKITYQQRSIQKMANEDDPSLNV